MGLGNLNKETNHMDSSNTLDSLFQTNIAYLTDMGCNITISPNMVLDQAQDCHRFPNITMEVDWGGSEGWISGAFSVLRWQGDYGFRWRWRWK